MGSVVESCSHSCEQRRDRFLWIYASPANGLCGFVRSRPFQTRAFFQNRYKSIVCEEDAYFKELVRSMGGWSEVVSMRRLGLRERSSEGILESGDFVSEVIHNAEASIRQPFSGHERGEKMDGYVVERCRDRGVNVKELQSGGRRPRVSRIRREMAREPLQKYGVPLAEIARSVGVATSAISKTLHRSER